ncbi:hypothetical protein B0F87_107150 [Methylobacter tundripaludum]|uniref:Uncharacterized protein n=1 Tax=Methylobacter tundripaludum TaxID=173365 RepID=A0A2S6HBQ4_9GAMM|nr:hypothetical protein [Methylobacter tundripaludum]PPK74907.1 hypothetical protein B0F87_107150 [Methylobacter tundripaludum]
MINYAIIGTPQGFKCEQWNYLSDNSVDAKQLADYIQSQLDIKTKLILPSKTAELFLFKTELKNGKKLDSFILYRGADEINISRPGSFYGAAIIVLDREFISIESVIASLRELADIVKLHCITNNRFMGNLSLVDEALSTIPASIKKLSETSKQGINNQSTTNASYTTKFYLVNELNVPLEKAAFKFYEKIIKKYQQADIYFSSSECFTSLPVSQYPNSQATPPNKPKIPANINLDNNDDNILLTTQKMSLFPDKRPSTSHHPRQNTIQSKSSKDTSTWVFITLICSVLSLLASVLTLVIVLSKYYSQNSNPDLLEITKTISQLRADIDKLNPSSKDAKTTSGSSESQPIKIEIDKQKDELNVSSKEIKTTSGNNESQLTNNKEQPNETSTSTSEPISHKVTEKETTTDQIAINICNEPKYNCSQEELNAYKKALSKAYPIIHRGEEITTPPKKQ